MYIASFPEANVILDTDDPDAVPASALLGVTDKGEYQTITCWKVTQEELDEINKTGRVWLILFGEQICASFISGIRPFRSEGEIT